MTFTIIGCGLFFVIGIMVGVSIMYGFEAFMDWKEDKEDKK